MKKKLISLKKPLLEKGLSQDIVDEEISIAWLDFKKAAITKETKITLEDKELIVNSDMIEIENNAQGLEQLDDIPEPYQSAILMVWDYNQDKLKSENLIKKGTK